MSAHGNAWGLLRPRRGEVVLAIWIRLCTCCGRVVVSGRGLLEELKKIIRPQCSGLRSRATSPCRTPSFVQAAIGLQPEGRGFIAFAFAFAFAFACASGLRLLGVMC